MTIAATMAGRMASKRIAVFSAVVSLLCLLGEGVYCWRTPTAYFDTMAYAAIAKGGANDFAGAGAECSAQVPDKRDSCGVVAGSAMFAEAAAYSEADFAQFLRFYTVKPLYCGLAAGLNRWLGVGAFTGLRMISVGSFLLIGVVSWAWLREHVPAAVAPVVAFWMTAAGPVLALGKDLLPDGLSTALLLLGMYGLLYGRVKWMGWAVLALAVLARPDDMLLVLCFGCVWVWRARRRWILCGAFAVGCAAVSFGLGKATGALGWAVLFRRSFFEMLPPERFAAAHVSLREYGQVMAVSGVRTVMFCLPAAVFLGLLVMVGEQRLARPEFGLRSLVAVSAAAIAMRVVLYPGMEERYYVWFYLVCALALACLVGSGRRQKPGEGRA